MPNRLSRRGRRPSQKVVDVPLFCSSLVACVGSTYVYFFLTWFERHFAADLAQFIWDVRLVSVSSLFASLAALFPRQKLFKFAQNITSALASAIGQPLTGIQFIWVMNAGITSYIGGIRSLLFAIFCMDYFFSIRHLRTILPLLGAVPVFATTFKFCLATDVFFPALLSSIAVLLTPFLPSIARRNDDVTVLGRYIFRIREIHWLNLTRLFGLLCNMVCICNLLILFPNTEVPKQLNGSMTRYTGPPTKTPLPFMSYLLPLRTGNFTSFMEFAVAYEKQGFVAADAMVNSHAEL